MKKKIILALSVMFILGLTVAVFALSQAKNINTSAAAESCAMMSQNAGGEAKTSCCDKADCCCKGDSCPMKNNGENASANCCSNCCGDSCPMKNKSSEAAGVDMKNVSVAVGESCCSGGACCKGKKI